MTDVPEYTADSPEYTAEPGPNGIWLLLDPAGNQVMFYGPERDGDLAEYIARGEAAVETFKLRFMADALGVSRQQFVEALRACRAEVDAKIAAGAL